MAERAPSREFIDHRLGNCDVADQLRKDIQQAELMKVL